MRRSFDSNLIVIKFKSFTGYLLRAITMIAPRCTFTINMPGIFVTLLLTCLSSIRAQDTASFTYKELNRGVLSVADFLVVRDCGGYAISVSLTRGKERIRQELVCDSTFATIWWRYVSDANTDISFRR